MCRQVKGEPVDSSMFVEGCPFKDIASMDDIIDVETGQFYYEVDPNAFGSNKTALEIALRNLQVKKDEVKGIGSYLTNKAIRGVCGNNVTIKRFKGQDNIPTDIATQLKYQIVNETVLVWISRG